MSRRDTHPLSLISDLSEVTDETPCLWSNRCFSSRNCRDVLCFINDMITQGHGVLCDHGSSRTVLYCTVKNLQVKADFMQIHNSLVFSLSFSLFLIVPPPPPPHSLLLGFPGHSHSCQTIWTPPDHKVLSLEPHTHSQNS